jgi:serine/threonine protein kinase
MSTSRIGRYEIIDELGEGGMAVVYLARDPYMDRKVAVKVLSYQLAADALFLEHFHHEAEIIAALEHPCIVPVYDFGLQGDQPYIVMRYMAGGSLQDRLEDESEELGLHQMARIVDRVAGALDAAHAHDVVHRDVKPSNVLFDVSGEAFLSDFGLAKSSRRPIESEDTLFVGTPAYMSPEQVCDSPLDGRSDVYALGAMVYRVLADQPPYLEDTLTATARAHIIEPVPDILHVRPDLRSPWREIIAKAMAKAPRDRYGTAGELAREIHEAVSGRWYLRKLVFD